MKPAKPILVLLVLAACHGTARAGNPCRSGAYLELTRMDPDSLTNRQFVNLLKYRERCEEYNLERLKLIEKNLQDDDFTYWYYGAVLAGVVFLYITAFRF